MTDPKRADDALRQSKERQTLLLTLSDAVRAETDAEAVANRAPRMLCDALKRDRGCIASCRLADDCVDALYQMGNDVCPPCPRSRAPRNFPKCSRWSTTEPWLSTTSPRPST